MLPANPLCLVIVGGFLLELIDTVTSDYDKMNRKGRHLKEAEKDH